MTCCVFFTRKSVVAREVLLKIDTLLAIASSGSRTNLLLQEALPKKELTMNTADRKRDNLKLAYVRRSPDLQTTLPRTKVRLVDQSQGP